MTSSSLELLMREHVTNKHLVNLVHEYLHYCGKECVAHLPRLRIAVFIKDVLGKHANDPHLAAYYFLMDEPIAGFDRNWFINDIRNIEREAQSRVTIHQDGSLL